MRIITPPEPTLPHLTLIRNERWRERPPEACQHIAFILDDEWQIVTCAECEVRVDAYVILRKHAEYWERLKGDEARIELRRKELVAEEIKALIQRVGIPDALVARAKAVVTWGHWSNRTREELLALKHELSDALRAVRGARKNARKVTRA